MAEAEKTFLEHLQELKRRLIRVLLSLVIGSVIGYLIREPIISILLLSRSEPLYYGSPAGGLDFVIRICLLFGLLVSLPVLLYEVIGFLKPILPRHSKLSVIWMLLLSLLLMSAGVGFAYWISLPAALRFLSGFGSAQVKSLISANEYLSFVTAYLVGFVVIFQLPLVMLLLNRIRRFQIRQLLRWERYVVLISFVLAAFLTPTPDLANQAIMALPLIGLYQITMVLIFLANKYYYGSNGHHD